MLCDLSNISPIEEIYASPIEGKCIKTRMSFVCVYFCVATYLKFSASLKCNILRLIDQITLKN